jgi:DNA-binding winged helix-turn-helix (wHTH) protein
MILAFGQFELDTDRVELRADGAAVALEPQVFALLRYLIENRDRMVSKDEIVDAIWGGRIVSDSAVTSRIKSVRQAVGDDGRAQRIIRTVHGRGFRFVADVTTAPQVSVLQEPAPAAVEETEPSRPSIAVLPFRLVGVADPAFPIADALPHDLITELSRLHWLFVIARASSFRFRGGDITLDRVRAELNVRYCLTGVVEILGEAMSVSVELSDLRDKGIVWSERFRASIGAVHEIRDEIVGAVTAAVEVRIPLNEARRAQLASPASLDAWSAYHLGLHHMYRFNKADNEKATSFFERAVAMEPGFARAYAGLSFTHFQNAFLRYTDGEEASKLAQHYAAQSLERDPMDPFGHFTMGRTFWLRGDLESSLPWLERANSLNPSYAQARYSRGWTEALLGSAKSSQENIDAALALSPLDPLLYGMLGVRALSDIAQGKPDQAVDWAERAANSPGAHALIDMIAVVAHGLNANDSRARAWAESAHARAQHLNGDDFLRAFPFRDPPTRARVTATLKRFGF